MPAMIILFAILALVAGALGFGALEGLAASIAKILLIVFVVLFIISMLVRALKGKPPA